MWGTLDELHQCLLIARVKLYRKLLPDGVGAATMVAGVNSGKLTTAMLMDVKTAALKGGGSSEAKREALILVWPALLAMVGDVTPCDEQGKYALLRVAMDAFDLTGASYAPVERIVQPVFDEMNERSTNYLKRAARWSRRGARA